MITDKQKKNILGIIYSMKHREELWFKSFSPEEREYIMSLIVNQKGDKGFSIETNGLSTEPNTITIFRKNIHYWDK